MVPWWVYTLFREKYLNQFYVRNNSVGIFRMCGQTFFAKILLKVAESLTMEHFHYWAMLLDFCNLKHLNMIQTSYLNNISATDD